MTRQSDRLPQQTTADQLVRDADGAGDQSHCAGGDADQNQKLETDRKDFVEATPVEQAGGRLAIWRMRRQKQREDPERRRVRPDAGDGAPRPAFRQKSRVRGGVPERRVPIQKRQDASAEVRCYQGNGGAVENEAEERGVGRVMIIIGGKQSQCPE